MGRRKGRAGFKVEKVLAFFNHLLEEKPSIAVLIPLLLVCWGIEKWVFSFSNWVPLVVAIWATFQHCSHRQKLLVEDLNKKWKRVVLNTSPITPLEHCEWLNKLLMEIWTNYMNPKLATRFSSIVEKRLKQHRSKLIEKIELQEFSLGSCPPYLGPHGTCWATLGDQRIMNLGFDWDTSDMSILLLAKLAKPLMGTARIVINSLHIKGELLLMPVLDGRAVLYSFVSTPEVRIGVAFGSGGSQSLPATELPGVSSWLVKVLTDTLVKTMVEPQRRCYCLPAVDLRKKAVGGIVFVSVISARKLSRSNLRGSPPRREQSHSLNGSLVEHFDDKDLRTFVEVELGQLTRRTEVIPGSSPSWDSTFNMVLHGDTGTLRLHLYNYPPNSVKYDYLASCEIKMKYAADDSTAFWAIGPDSGVIAKHAEFCGNEVEMVVPFEGVTSGELTVKIVVKEWQFSDGSLSLNKFNISSQKLMYGSSILLSRTGRKINVAIMEGKDLISKERSGKCDPYVKLQYGKVLQKTRTAHNSNPFWNQKFEFDEIVDDGCLKIKCYSEETFGDENIGSARVNLEGLLEGSIRDIWVPLERVNSGELRLQIEAVRVNDSEGSRGSVSGSFNGWIELILVEAKDLIAADIRGTSDPYVRVQYGSSKKRTKVMYKTLNPQWNQTLEFPDDGSPLELHVKDYNALFPTYSIGDCVVEYQGLPPNQTSDKWIPLQGMKQSMVKLQSLIEDGNLEGLSTALSKMQSLEDIQEEYTVQLETEQMLLLNKIKELGQEIMSSSSSLSSRSSGF
uniref:C2 domain-containing family protein n=1 Tax=Populus alba TaxID=43335 RepID=A0A4U5P2E5_POPAL|nr:C2 domain-containing family protein [Populus alba]